MLTYNLMGSSDAVMQVCEKFELKVVDVFGEPGNEVDINVEVPDNQADQVTTMCEELKIVCELV